MGRKIHRYNEVTSTNDVAKELALKGSEEGTIVIAEIQSHGRGRRGKKWISPRGGIWFSVILRPDICPKTALKMTLFTAVAVAKTIEDMYHLSAEIKWPNDVLINGKKVCGVLLETSTTDSLVNFVVVGIGINTNIDHSSFSEDLETATSLKEELQKEVNNATLLKTLLEKLEYYYAMFLENESELVEEWKRFDCTLGTNIEVVDPNERFEGRAIDVDDDGALLVKIENGSVRRVLSSSIVLRKLKS